MPTVLAKKRSQHFRLVGKLPWCNRTAEQASCVTMHKDQHAVLLFFCVFIVQAKTVRWINQFCLRLPKVCLAGLLDVFWRVIMINFDQLRVKNFVQTLFLCCCFTKKIAVVTNNWCSEASCLSCCITILGKRKRKKLQLCRVMKLM